MARVTDPVGAHGGSKGFSWMAIGAAIGGAVAVAAMIAFPPAGLIGIAVAGLGAISTTTGVAAIGGKLGKLQKTESGASCSQIAKGAARTKCEGKLVARIGDANSHNQSAVKSGSAKVFVEGMPVTRVGESATCGGNKILAGASKTGVGGESVSSGAASAVDADEKSLDTWIEHLDTISKWTGLASLPLLGVSVFRAGASAAMGQAAKKMSQAAFDKTYAEAAKRTTAELARREATQAAVNASSRAAMVKAGAVGGAVATAKTGAKVGAIMGASIYGKTYVGDGIQSVTGISKAEADLYAQGALMLGPQAIPAMSLRPASPKAWGSSLGQVKSDLLQGNWHDAAFGQGLNRLPSAAIAEERPPARDMGDLVQGPDGVYAPREAPIRQPALPAPEALLALPVAQQRLALAAPEQAPALPAPAQPPALSAPPGAGASGAAGPAVPAEAWPTPYPAPPPGATVVSSVERVSPGQVTSVVQGEVQRSIVDQKVAQIQDILDGGPGKLPMVSLAPDPLNPNGLKVIDGSHTFAAYKELGFEQVPAKVYNDNGVAFLERQGAYLREQTFPIDELRTVDQFSGTPAEQFAARAKPEGSDAGRLPAPSADQVREAIVGLERDHGLKFGQDFLFIEGTPAPGTNKPGSGVREKMELISNWKDGDPPIELPKLNTEGHIWEGHHTAVALQLLGEMGGLAPMLRADAIKIKPTTTYPATIDSVKIMDASGKVVRGPGAPKGDPSPAPANRLVGETTTSLAERTNTATAATSGKSDASVGSCTTCGGAAGQPGALPTNESVMLSGGSQGGAQSAWKPRNQSDSFDFTQRPAGTKGDDYGSRYISEAQLRQSAGGRLGSGGPAEFRRQQAQHLSKLVQEAEVEAYMRDRGRLGTDRQFLAMAQENPAGPSAASPHVDPAIRDGNSYFHLREGWTEVQVHGNGDGTFSTQLANGVSRRMSVDEVAAAIRAESPDGPVMLTSCEAGRSEVLDFGGGQKMTLDSAAQKLADRLNRPVLAADHIVMDNIPRARSGNHPAAPKLVLDSTQRESAAGRWTAVYPKADPYVPPAGMTRAQHRKALLEDLVADREAGPIGERRINADLGDLDFTGPGVEVTEIPYDPATFGHRDPMDLDFTSLGGRSGVDPLFTSVRSTAQPAPPGKASVGSCTTCGGAAGHPGALPANPATATTQLSTSGATSAWTTAKAAAKPPPKGGAARAAEHGVGWQKASLNDTIAKFAPGVPGVPNAAGTKTIYTNPETGVSVVHDVAGNYFRIQDLKLTGKRAYLGLDGKLSNNKVIDGKQTGKSQSEYNEATHFANDDGAS